MIELKFTWDHSPIPLNKKFENHQELITIPIGSVIQINNSSKVDSVNGKNGIVTLDHQDVGADKLGSAQSVRDELSNYVSSVNSKTGDVSLNYLDVGADKAGSAQEVQVQLATKADLVNGLIPQSQLPSYVDDVLNGTFASETVFNDESGQPYTPEDGKIYVDVSTNKTYRWGSLSYVEIGGGGVALGETSSTAYRGDYGKIAHDHSQQLGNPHKTDGSNIDVSIQGFSINLNYILDAFNTSLTNYSTQIGNINVKLTTKADLVDGKVPLSQLPTNTWVPFSQVASEFSSGFTNLSIEFARIDGFLWMRGNFIISSSVSSGNSLFWIDSVDYKMYSNVTSSWVHNDSIQAAVAASVVELRSKSSGICTNATQALNSDQAIVAKSSLAATTSEYRVLPTIIGKLVIP